MLLFAQLGVRYYNKSNIKSRK